MSFSLFLEHTVWHTIFLCNTYIYYHIIWCMQCLWAGSVKNKCSMVQLVLKVERTCNQSSKPEKARKRRSLQPGGVQLRQPVPPAQGPWRQVAWAGPHQVLELVCRLSDLVSHQVHRPAIVSTEPDCFGCSGITATSHPIIKFYHIESYISFYHIRLHSFGPQLGMGILPSSVAWKGIWHSIVKLIVI